MKGFIGAVDRFCAKHPRFGIKNFMLYVIIGNAIVYLVSMMDSTGLFSAYLALWPAAILRGEVWRLVTFVFVPDAGNIIYLALFMYFYFFIGRTLEQVWGRGKFTIYYLFGMLLTIVCAFILHFAGFETMIYGARYINLSMFFAFATFFPEHKVLLFFFIPIKVKWLAIADAVFFVVEMVVNGFPLLLFPVAALLNFLLFCAQDLAAFLPRRAYAQRARVIDFEKERAKRAGAQTQSDPYERRCAVCGRTADEHPELEFRYCSRCAGYHCFCQDHIDSHIHFTEE